jgi:hypothetical protein
MQWYVRLAVAATILIAGTAGWISWRAYPPAPRPEPGPAIEIATVTQVRLHAPTGLSVVRLAENPNILILDFASLTRQGHMLDRVAALVEKADLPRDRILTTEELDRAVQADGDMPSGFYYGHDYSAASLVRFFALADRTAMELTSDEALLRSLLAREGWLKPGLAAGLISLPGLGANATITRGTRDAILAHELSHGEYFSNPSYADYVHRFWLTTLTEQERAGFRTFLHGEGYDTANPEIVENETQAYLLFTMDPHFFRPSLAGLTVARRAELRAAFLRGMQMGWLRDLLSTLQ